MPDHTYSCCEIFLGLVFIFIALVFAIVVLAVVINRHYKKVIELSKYQIDTSATIDDTIKNLLADIITECFEDYKLIVLYPLQEGAIDDKREEAIRKDLVEKVGERISDATLNKLSLRYNRINIGSVIADKIYITVMNYVLDHNTSIYKEKQ